MVWRPPHVGVYNPVHGHYVTLNKQRIFLGNHYDAYKRYWTEGAASFSDHGFLWASTNLTDWRPTMVQFEEGAEFDEENWARHGYIGANEADASVNIELLENGDVIFPVGAKMLSCCRTLGLDVQRVFPSCPQIMQGLIVVRGTWDADAGHYRLSYSRPVVISDLVSSRGVDEPTIIALRSGRIVVVFRGSNQISLAWHTRIEKDTPAHKWFTFSDDGGQTFTDPVPWHHDNREVFYSPSTISCFMRSTLTGKAYWFVNITGPKAYANAPRYPLVMAEVDEQTGFLRRATQAVIDDRNPDRDAEKLQLSNFSLLEDRET